MNKDNIKRIKKYIIEHAKEYEKTRKYNNDLDLQNALLLMELMELLEKAPEHCRIHLLKYAIHNTELVLQTREDKNDCYQCIYPCVDCDKLIHGGDKE